MSENIAGYVDRAYIKGNYYKYAASPKPVNFTGNIDEISEDLLTKAMVVTRGQVTGELPNDFGNVFLITTVKYGDNTYLQTAYLVQEGYECYEYRRIYSNTWTAWIGIDSAISEVDGKIQTVKETADACSAGLVAANNSISSLNTSVRDASNAVSQVSGKVDTLTSRVSSVERKTSSLGSVKLWEGKVTSGDILFNYGNYTAYLVVGEVINGHAWVSQVHLKAQILTTDVLYQLTDEVYWITYLLKYTGSTARLSIYNRNNSGSIRQIWGIN